MILDVNLDAEGAETRRSFVSYFMQYCRAYA
jgi:hypothetical protein